MARFPTDTTWLADLTYDLGTWIVPTAANGLFYECMQPGTSHAVTEPTWPTTVGQVVSDGTVTWKCLQYPEAYDVEEFEFDRPMNSVQFGKGYQERRSLGYEARTWKAKYLLLNGNFDNVLTFWRNRSGSVEKFDIDIPILGDETVQVWFAKDYKPTFRTVIHGGYTALEVEIVVEEAF